MSEEQNILLTNSGRSRSKTSGPYWSISELHWSARSPNKLHTCLTSFRISFCEKKWKMSQWLILLTLGLKRKRRIKTENGPWIKINHHLPLVVCLFCEKRRKVMSCLDIEHGTPYVPTTGPTYIFCIRTTEVCFCLFIWHQTYTKTSNKLSIIASIKNYKDTKKSKCWDFITHKIWLHVQTYFQWGCWTKWT